MARVLIITDVRLHADWILVTLMGRLGDGSVPVAVDADSARSIVRRGGIHLAILDLTTACAGEILNLLLAEHDCPRILAVLGSGSGTPAGGLASPRVRCLSRSASLRDFMGGALEALSPAGSSMSGGLDWASTSPEGVGVAMDGHRRAGRKLSPREGQVLALVKDGYSNKEVAEALRIALPTAKTHVRSVLRKMGAHSRLQLDVAAAQELEMEEGSACEGRSLADEAMTSQARGSGLTGQPATMELLPK
jgi:DNA-binding NarL/FixJ family response regulator